MKRALVAVALFAAPLLAAPAQACDMRHCPWSAPVCEATDFVLCDRSAKEVVCDWIDPYLVNPPC